MVTSSSLTNSERLALLGRLHAHLKLSIPSANRSAKKVSEDWMCWQSVNTTFNGASLAVREQHSSFTVRFVDPRAAYRSDQGLTVAQAFEDGGHVHSRIAMHPQWSQEMGIAFERYGQCDHLRIPEPL